MKVSIRIYSCLRKGTSTTFHEMSDVNLKISVGVVCELFLEWYLLLNPDFLNVRIIPSL